MRKIGIIFILFLLLSSCTTSKTMTNSQSSSINTDNVIRDGSSFEKAIIINERNESTGVHAEYEWIKNHYPGYKRGMQALTHNKNKPYDIISITTSEGKEIDVYFDISNFYGKF